MPITQELKDKIDTYQQSYSPTEILDSLKNSGKYPDISGKIDSYRQSYSDDEILNSIKSQPVQNLQNDEGFFTRVNKAMQERGGKIYDVTREGSTPEKIFRVAGQEVAALTDVGLEGIKSLYKTLMPDKYQESISQGIKDIAASPAGQSTLNAIQGAAQGWEYFRKENPNIAMDAEAAMNIGGPLSAAKALKAFTTLTKPGVQAAAQVGGAVAKEPLQFLGDISAMAKGNKNLDSQITDIVKESFPKSIRPSQKNLGGTADSSNKYYEKASQAVKDIVENKNLTDVKGNKLIEFYDKKGNPVKNNLPQSIADQSEAVQIGKQRTIGEALQKLSEAEGKGAVLDVNPIIGKLENTLVKQQKSLSHDPTTESYIKGVLEKFDSYRESGVPLTVAQEELTKLNNKLSKTWNKVEYDSYGKQEVDSFIASELRKGLDDVITQYKGPGFSDLKKKFGAYKTIEEDTARRAAQVSKSPKFTLFDASDIWIGYHTGLALFTGNLPALGASAVAEMAKKTMKKLNSPDHQIKRMYEKIDGLIESSNRATNPKSKTMKFITQKGPKR